MVTNRMVTTKTDLSALREDFRQAEGVFAALFPERRSRNHVFRILGDAIKVAHRVAPASWGVSLFPQRVCLNVGRGAILQLVPGEIVFIVSARHLKGVSRVARQAFGTTVRYRFVRDAVEGSLVLKDLRLYPELSAAHRDLIERAAANRKVCFWPKAHSPAVLAVLRESGCEVPPPDYSIDIAVHDNPMLPDLDELDRATSEGRQVLRTHLQAERKSGLAERKKQSVLRRKGHLGCEVCGFDFAQVYGSVGENFAEVHHSLPLGGDAKQRMTRLEDLAVVCSNCHRMLHRGEPVFSVIELQTRLKNARPGRE